MQRTSLAAAFVLLAFAAVASSQSTMPTFPVSIPFTVVRTTQLSPAEVSSVQTVLTSTGAFSAVTCNNGIMVTSAGPWTVTCSCTLLPTGNPQAGKLENGVRSNLFIVL